jgi:hypothetical protein
VHHHFIADLDVGDVLADLVDDAGSVAAADMEGLGFAGLVAFQKEVVTTPTIADDEVLVYVMAAGVNYNNVWAGLGVPVNVIAAAPASRQASNDRAEPAPARHLPGNARASRATMSCPAC